MSLFTTLLVIAVVVQRSANTFILHTAGEKAIYSGTVAILMSELLKQAICWSIAIYEEYRAGKRDSLHEYISIASDIDDEEKPLVETEGSSRLSQDGTKPSIHFQNLPRPYGIEKRKGFLNALERVKQKTFTKKAFLLSIPAGIYVIQNNLIFYAIPRMEPSVFQAAWQIRLLPTAFLSTYILCRSISVKRWLCLLGVVQGVMILESPQLFKSMGGLHIAESHNLMGNVLVKSDFYSGTIALLLAAILSAFAAVLLEKIYINKETDLWIANFQLSFFSLLPALFLVSLECFKANSFFIPFNSLFHSLWPWYAILAQTFVGILVGLMTKFSGSVGNGLAGTGSIALTSCVTILFPSQEKTTLANTLIMILGIILIIFCTHLYSSYGNKEVNILSEESQNIQAEGKMKSDQEA